MILTLSTDDMLSYSLPAFPYHYATHANEDQNLTSDLHLKNLEACGPDLEPLPLFSPPCFETLCTVDPSIFDPYPIDEVWQSMPAPTSPPPRAVQPDEGSYTADIQGPSAYDVVCSRIKRFYHLPGCERFRLIVRAFIPAYLHASTRLGKSAVIASAIAMILDHPEGGHVRFLKYHSASKTWSILGSEQIRDKVGHALRETVQEMERERRKKTHSIRQVAARAS